jgi:hypothetical protein
LRRCSSGATARAVPLWVEQSVLAIRAALAAAMLPEPANDDTLPGDGERGLKKHKCPQITQIFADTLPGDGERGLQLWLAAIGASSSALNVMTRTVKPDSQRLNFMTPRVEADSRRLNFMP